MPDREKKLREVFQAFDLDGDGAIGAEELLVLGQQRRKLGQKSGEWTKEMNMRLMKKLDKNGDGKVLVREFVDFFDEQLPSLNSMFYHHCDAFLQVAQSLGKTSAPAVEPAPAAGKGRARAMQEAIKNIASKEDLVKDRRAAERRLMQDPSLPTQLGKSAEPVVQKDWSAAKQAGETFYKIAEADKPVQQQPKHKDQSPSEDRRDLSASARAEAILYGKDELTSQRVAAASKTLSAAERAEAILYGTGQSSEWDVYGERSVSVSPEFKQEVDDEFNRWDENQDGVIDREEFTKMRIAVAHKEAERIRSEARSMSKSISKSQSPKHGEF
jgi:Ca2+-binding EF-hand superfamily protein